MSMRISWEDENKDEKKKKNTDENIGKSFKYKTEIYW